MFPSVVNQLLAEYVSVAFLSHGGHGVVFVSSTYQDYACKWCGTPEKPEKMSGVEGSIDPHYVEERGRIVCMDNLTFLCFKKRKMLSYCS